MDDMDHAQQLEEQQRQQALRHALATSGDAPEHDTAGNRTCLDCGAIIPQERVAAINAVRCVDCQTAMEKHNKGRAS